jgi:hypothetical protein
MFKDAAGETGARMIGVKLDAIQAKFHVPETEFPVPPK